MRSTRAFVALGAATLGALSLVACGSDRGVVTSPSSMQTAAAPSGAVSVTPEQILPAGTVNTTTPITVTSLVSGTSCPTLQFMVSSYLFNVDAATQYSGGTCANIQSGAKINFNGTRLSETSGVFYVTQLSFVTTTTTPTPTPTPTSTPVQTEGTITATGAGMCPELQFLFGSYAFNVSYATQYYGGACADLKAGAKVAIVGTKKETESFVRVASLAFKADTPAPAPQPPPTTPFTTDVTVSSLVSGTSCPTLSFMVGPYKVSVSSSTTFEHGACANIAAGMTLGLTALRQGDGVIAALKIAFRDTTTNPTNPSARPVEGEGTIGSLSGTTACPTLQFYIGSYLIKLDGSTQYVGGFCTDLKAGLKVGVKGTMGSDGSVAATVITVKSEEPRPEAEGEGFVTALVDGTSCPSLQFKISEYTITLTPSTQFSGGSCTDVAPGRKLGVRGTMTGERAATASLITFKP